MGVPSSIFSAISMPSIPTAPELHQEFFEFDKHKEG
jgi:hypothetical protein